MSAPLALPTEVLGQEVPPSRVSKALRELWADESGKTRASLMNFAIYCEQASRLEANTEVMAALTREQSCRALLIFNDVQATEAATRAWVTAHCQLYDGKRSVCCEQLSFVLAGGNADQIRNTLFANLDSDLPLVLWWQGPLNERLDERFLSALDGLIVDSREFTDPALEVQQLITARAQSSARFTLSDLAWMRSHFMRTALASQCQNPHVIRALQRLDHIEITHAPGHEISALMTAAWIGAQLGAKVGPGRSFVRADAPTMQLSLKVGTPGCALQGLTLRGKDMCIDIARAEASSFVSASATLDGISSAIMQPADFRDDASLIAEQLSRFGGTTRYFEMLPLLVQLLR